MFEYRPVTHAELLRLWEKSILGHPGDERWVRWRDGALLGHELGTMQTFGVICGGEPVGEGTLMLSPDCPQIGGRKMLADGVSCANINGLRIEKPFEGLGHISRMVRAMEEFARGRGMYTTIGVEACGTRNMGIYLHWGYSSLVHYEVEDGELVLYYAKRG